MNRRAIVLFLVVLDQATFVTDFYFQAPNDQVVIAKEKGLGALSDPTYLHNHKMLLIFGTLQAATLIFAVFLTALKPWKKRNQTN